jgi:hypothetical protein
VDFGDQIAKGILDGLKAGLSAATQRETLEATFGKLFAKRAAAMAEEPGLVSGGLRGWRDWAMRGGPFGADLFPGSTRMTGRLLQTLVGEPAFWQQYAERTQARRAGRKGGLFGLEERPFERGQLPTARFPSIEEAIEAGVSKERIGAYLADIARTKTYAGRRAGETNEGARGQYFREQIIASYTKRSAELDRRIEQYEMAAREGFPALYERVAAMREESAQLKKSAQLLRYTTMTQEDLRTALDDRAKVLKKLAAQEKTQLQVGVGFVDIGRSPMEVVKNVAEEYYKRLEKTQELEERWYSGGRVKRGELAKARAAFSEIDRFATLFKREYLAPGLTVGQAVTRTPAGLSGWGVYREQHLLGMLTQFQFPGSRAQLWNRLVELNKEQFMEASGPAAKLREFRQMVYSSHQAWLSEAMQAQEQLQVQNQQLVKLTNIEAVLNTFHGELTPFLTERTQSVQKFLTLPRHAASGMVLPDVRRGGPKH